MPIRLKMTTHCQSRILERKISIADIKTVISEPDKKQVAFNDKIRVQKKIGKKTLEVIYCKESFRDTPNTYIIVTAYYISDKK